MKGSVHSGYKHGLGGMLPGLELDCAPWNHVALEKLYNILYLCFVTFLSRSIININLFFS